MSSNHNDINTINLNNYEEYFLLYTDNELDAAQVKMVDEFVQANPALKTELELFLSLRLPGEETNLINKEELMSEAMKLNIADESLLLYIDKELTPQQEIDFEKKLSENKSLRDEYQLLLKTKLAPSDKITYPNKKELLKKADRRVPVGLWIRIAAIFILILFSAVFYFSGIRSVKPAQPGIASQSASQPAKRTIVQKPAVAETITASSKAIPEHGVVNKIITPVIRNRRKETPNENNAVAKSFRQDNNKIINKPDSQLPVIAINDINPLRTDTRGAIDSKLIAATTPVIDQASTSNLNNKVTSLDAPRLTNEAATTINNRKGSLKIFLRKATRMIEKRTGIEPSDDNDELLIGAVAVKLK